MTAFWCNKLFYNITHFNCKFVWHLFAPQTGMYLFYWYFATLESDSLLSKVQEEAPALQNYIILATAPTASFRRFKPSSISSCEMINGGSIRTVCALVSVPETKTPRLNNSAETL